MNTILLKIILKTIITTIDVMLLTAIYLFPGSRKTVTGAIVFIALNITAMWL